jgi:hypothetical protein
MAHRVDHDWLILDDRSGLGKVIEEEGEVKECVFD